MSKSISVVGLHLNKDYKICLLTSYELIPKHLCYKSNFIQSLQLFIIYFTKIVIIKFQNKFQA